MGDGPMKAGKGGEPFLLIPLNGRNVQAPFTKLCCAELGFLLFWSLNEPPKAAVRSFPLSLLYITLGLRPRSLQAFHAEENLPLIN